MTVTLKFSLMGFLLHYCREKVFSGYFVPKWIFSEVVIVCKLLMKCIHTTVTDQVLSYNSVSCLPNRAVHIENTFIKEMRD